MLGSLRSYIHDLQVWPPEAFEEGAEFLESFSKSFAHAHGFRLKSAFADTLIQLIHPIGKVCKSPTFLSVTVTFAVRLPKRRPTIQYGQRQSS